MIHIPAPFWATDVTNKLLRPHKECKKRVLCVQSFPTFFFIIINYCYMIYNFSLPPPYLSLVLHSPLYLNYAISTIHTKTPPDTAAVNAKQNDKSERDACVKSGEPFLVDPLPPLLPSNPITNTQRTQFCTRAKRYRPGYYTSSSFIYLSGAGRG
jgi:hypothetical protein